MDSWVGYLVCRTVFLGQEIAEDDLLDLVRLLPPPPGPSAGEAG
ncbi:hypothetical protein [Streptomyces atroolivaceus]|nr:hypothetical protein [Streptomyces atroolivaceus]